MAFQGIRATFVPPEKEVSDLDKVMKGMQIAESAFGIVSKGFAIKESLTKTGAEKEKADMEAKKHKELFPLQKSVAEEEAKRQPFLTREAELKAHIADQRAAGGISVDELNKDYQEVGEDFKAPKGTIIETKNVFKTTYNPETKSYESTSTPVRVVRKGESSKGAAIEFKIGEAGRKAEVKATKEETRLSEKGSKELVEAKKFAIAEFNKDAEVKAAAISDTYSNRLMNIVKQDNPTLFAQLPVVLRKASGDVGNIAVWEQTATGDQSITTRTLNWLTQQGVGKPSQAQIKQIENLAREMKAEAIRQKQAIGLEKANQAIRAYGLGDSQTPEDFRDTIFGVSFSNRDPSKGAPLPGRSGGVQPTKASTGFDPDAFLKKTR
mgnify:CR=1 FL=1